IRDKLVTGVQTCALPIYRASAIENEENGSPRGARDPLGRRREGRSRAGEARRRAVREAEQVFLRVRRPRYALGQDGEDRQEGVRSEERRVGKEGRYKWWP